MVNFTIDQIRAMMDRRENIRNMSVIAHVDHGKSTLTDSLLSKAGMMAEADAGDKRTTDTRQDEIDRGITIKSTSVSLYYEREPDAEERENGITEAMPFLINLIDSPGHVDFSSEVTAALRVTDGALVVVDCIEGVCVQTETVLRQAIDERIIPVLFLNKLDRVFLEQHLPREEAYQTFRAAVESVNVVISTYKDETMPDIQVYPEKGTVAFGSGLHGWGFSLERFALMYNKKLGLPKDKMMTRLWGENFYNAKGKKWTSKPVTDGVQNERGFCKFILDPIEMLFDAIMEDKKEVFAKYIKGLGIKVPKDAEDLTGKALLKRVMQSWLPAAECLLDMMVKHLPSPVHAQKYRCDTLYPGPADDECALAVKKCDPNGPLMMYVSKMVPSSDGGRFFAFGRVFSGVVRTGQTVRILGPDYNVGEKRDLHVKKVQRTVLLMAGKIEQIADCPCGNIVGLVGIDQFLLKSGTLTTSEVAHPFVTMKFSVSPVVRRAVEPKNAQDLPKLVEGLKRLAKSDPMVLVYTAKTGEHIVAGAGELHLEICLNDLQFEYMQGAPITVGNPVVNFCETVSTVSEMQCVSKSPNKHNRLYFTAGPIEEGLIRDIENDDIKIEQEAKVRGRVMADKYGWDVNEARKVWAFGCPPDGKGNVLVDTTKAAQFLSEIKDSLVGAFMQTTSGGVFADEALRGIRFNLEDVVLHADAIHRGAGQLMPCAKRVFSACQIKSGPKLMEPLYLVEITVPQVAVSGVYNTLSQRRGIVEKETQKAGTPMTKVQALLPVTESFGFTELLRKNTAGQAFPQMVFSHFAEVAGLITDEGSQANKIVLQIRERKGMKASLPAFGDYYDKI